MPRKNINLLFVDYPIICLNFHILIKSKHILSDLNNTVKFKNYYLLNKMIMLSYTSMRLASFYSGSLYPNKWLYSSL